MPKIPAPYRVLSRCGLRASLVTTAWIWAALSWGNLCTGAERQPERQQLVVNSVGMQLVLVPAGSFLMGSPTDEPGREEEEHLHHVHISRSFLIGTTEVTQRQYELIMGENPSLFQSGSQEGDSAERPVDSVSWFEAVEFCRRLSALCAERSAGRTYRLPTEAEWEYACRAGTKTSWYFGQSVEQLKLHAWYRTEPSRQTQPVKQKRANPLGIHDLYGNVWEWCADWYAADYYLHSPSSDPAGPEAGDARVIRGGGWFSPPYNCRSASRRCDPPIVQDHDVGFRVVCEFN